MNDIDNNEDSTNGGIYSKFRERIRNIRIFRLRKKVENNKFIDDKVNYIREVIGNDKNIVSNRKKRVGFVVEKDDKKRFNVIGKVPFVKDEDNVRENCINSKVELIRENKPKYFKNKKVSAEYLHERKDVEDIPVKEKEDLIKRSSVEIIEKLRFCFEEKKDELEVIESELFLLNSKENSELELDKVREIKKRIDDLIERINVIVNQYNLYKSNYYIDNVIGIDSSVLVDDIIYYRNLLDSLDNQKSFVKEYKALDEFKGLYNQLKVVQDDADRLVKDNEEKIVLYGIRDSKYDKIKADMIRVRDIDNKCSLEINRQNEYLKSLMGKIGNVKSEEYITYQVKGIGELIGNTLKYMGLMLISPFSGFIPGIAVQALATKKMINNIRDNLNPEEVRKIRYSVIDYEKNLNDHLNDIYYVEDLLSSTLSDIESFKEDFMSIYNSNIPLYEDTLKNILKIEENIIHNQNKVNIVKNNLKRNKLLNERAVKLVKDKNKDS